jgi:hypothetical protein
MHRRRSTHGQGSGARRDCCSITPADATRRGSYFAQLSRGPLRELINREDARARDALGTQVGLLYRPRPVSGTSTNRT